MHQTYCVPLLKWDHWCILYGSCLAGDLPFHFRKLDIHSLTSVVHCFFRVIDQVNLFLMSVISILFQCEDAHKINQANHEQHQ